VALPIARTSRFFSRVSEPLRAPSSPPHRHVAEPRPVSFIGRGLVGGVVAAAALVGLLIGMGRRAGTAFRPLNATAYVLLGTRSDNVWGFDGVVTIVGCVVVLVVSAMAGLVVARLAPSHRTFRVLVAAAGVALVGYYLHLHVAARAVGGLSALLSLGELRALYVTLALALVLGMRLAFSSGTSAVRH
jgi:choline-glycine betaine transporter